MAKKIWSVFIEQSTGREESLEEVLVSTSMNEDEITEWANTIYLPNYFGEGTKWDRLRLTAWDGWQSRASLRNVRPYKLHTVLDIDSDPSGETLLKTD